MDHADHVRLLHAGIASPGGTWADLGSGTGAFTLALADLIGPKGRIFSVDKQRGKLERQKRAFAARTEAANPPEVIFLQGDFTHSLELPSLDGVVMANALHFFRDKQAVIRHVRSFLKPDGRFILVEYNVDRGNLWVPYPLSYPTWEKLASQCGFVHTRLLQKVPSSFLKEFYSALSR
jgi:ubiquinone/menaquinone biosynthesis C-methylase UbiE